MELYDDRKNEKKSKMPMIIGICIIVLVILIMIILYGIVYLKNSITTIKIDGKKNDKIEELLHVESTDNGFEIYVPIIKFAEYLNYEGFSGDYKNKSEDKTKCHVTDEEGNEVAMFTLNSDILVKEAKDSVVEYIKLDKATFEKDGELYTTEQGIENAFNVVISYDKKLKNIEIESMDYLVEVWAKAFNIKKYVEEFNDKKAILEGMFIKEEDEQYGVINIATNEPLLETKYEEISYLPATKEFLVKSNGKYGVVTKEAQVKVKTVYDNIITIDNKLGLYLVKQNNAYGVIDTNGGVIIEPEYKQIGIDIEKYAQNGVENNFVLLDEIIPAKNSENLWGLFNIKGEKITDFKYTSIGCKIAPASNSYPALVIPSYKIVVVEKDKHYNLVTSEGEELISGDIIDSVYLKTNATTEQNQFYMTYNGNTNGINIEEWLVKIGR